MASDASSPMNRTTGDGAHAGAGEKLVRRSLSPRGERRLLLGILALAWFSAGAWVWCHCGSWRGVVDAACGRPLSVQTVGFSRSEDGQMAVVTLQVRNLLLRDLLILGAARG